MLVYNLFWSFPGVIWNQPPYLEGKWETWKEAGHFRLVGDRLNKQRELAYKVCFGDHRMDGSSHPITKVLKVYIEALTGFSRVNCPGAVSTTSLCQDCVLGAAPRGGQASRTHVPRTGVGVWTSHHLDPAPGPRLWTSAHQRMGLISVS